MATRPIPAAVRERLLKIMPLMSSDQVGECAAAASRITHILKENGLDWHDLTASIGAGASSSSGNYGAGGGNYSSGGFYSSNAEAASRAAQEQARRQQEYARRRQQQQEDAARERREQEERYDRMRRAQAERDREAREEAVRRKRQEEMAREAQADREPPPPPPDQHTLQGVDVVQAIDLLLKSPVWLSENAKNFLNQSRARANGRATITFSEKQFQWFGDLLRKAGLL
jgi:hypothetical protein